MMKRFFFYVFFLLTHILYSQHTNLTLNTSLTSDLDRFLYSNKTDIHTSCRPIIKSNLSFSIDSAIARYYVSNYKNVYMRKLFSEHLFILGGNDYNVIVSPIFHFSKGKDLIDSDNTFVNSRGYLIEADLGNKFSFSTSFVENQAIFPNYLDSYIRDNRVVLGQGYARNFKGTGFDYAMSSGYVSYVPNTNFYLQFGHGKNFIGDGYRSLLLSDNTFNYPYLKIQTNFRKVQYTTVYAELMDINYFKIYDLPTSGQMGYPKKYLSLHYLSYNINNRFNLSFFESVIWKMNNNPNSHSFDINYLNPITLINQISNNEESPNNVFLGINSRYAFSSSYFYGQLLIDNFSCLNLNNLDSYWANNIGFQLGYKIFNPFSISRLTLQTEYNYVRPYTYAHNNPFQNYGHYNQSLSHPLGANFSEILFIGNYKWKRFAIDAKIMFAKQGKDFQGDSISYGANVYYSTGTYANAQGLTGISSGRPSDYGVEMYQGNLTTINFRSLNISYIINPVTNLKINIGIILRKSSNIDGDMKTRFINFGIMSDLFNRYYDI